MHPEPPTIDRPPNLRELCQRYNIRFKKSLGQNLLLDDNINRIMVEAAEIAPEDYVVEVGAGLGALTRRIAPQAKRLLSVEIDASFLTCLEDQFGALEHVRFFRGDILNHSLPRLVEEFIPGGASHKMLSNLPYYITTPVLFHFLESPLFFSRLVVMLQQEVGMRIVAPVGAENYGMLSLAARLYAAVDVVHQVPATCFIPQPKVDSSIVRFRCYRPEERASPDPKFVLKVAKAAFAQRRKTLRNSLTRSGHFGAPAETVLDALDAAGIDPGRRPQTLSLEDFVTLADQIKTRLQQ